MKAQASLIHLSVSGSYYLALYDEHHHALWGSNNVSNIAEMTWTLYYQK